MRLEQRKRLHLARTLRRENTNHLQSLGNEEEVTWPQRQRTGISPQGHVVFNPSELNDDHGRQLHMAPTSPVLSTLTGNGATGSSANREDARE